jgi:hypothetical protein
MAAMLRSMNMPMAFQNHSMFSATGRYRRRLIRTLLLVTLATAGAFAIHAAWHSAAAEPAMAIGDSQLVHWTDADHDWLLVNDRSAHALVVYDATTGRPLKRLGAASGMAEIEAIARQDDRLLVSSGLDAPLRALALPELRPVALASR